MSKMPPVPPEIREKVVLIQDTFREHLPLTVE